MFRRTSFWISIIALLLAGSVSYLYQEELLSLIAPTPEAEETEAAVASAEVRRGDMLIAIGGVGELMPARQINLSFGTSGTIIEMPIQVGDRVEADQLLALLDDTDLRRQVVQAGIDVRAAELAVAKLEEDASEADIASAQASLADAQVAYELLLAPPSTEEVIAAESQLESAEAALQELLTGLSNDEVLTLNADLRGTEVTLQQAQSAYNQVKWRADAGTTSQAADLQNATIAYEKALAQFNVSSAGPSGDQIASARAGVALAQESLNTLQQEAAPLEIQAAQARIAQAQAALDDLMGGPDANDLEVAELNVQQVRHNMDGLMTELAAASLIAPFDGVVTAINATAGESVGTETIITIADNATAEVQFWIEELDIENATVGNRIIYFFEAFPDVEFTGEVLRVEPSLVTLEGAPAVQAWGSINLEEHAMQPLFGMTTEVEIIAGEANNAFLVPIQSLRELVPGSFAVFVIDEAGELSMRPVEVGLRDFVNAEIISGLELGEVVSTGDVETQ